MNEIWVETGNVNNYNKTIVAISNMGRIKTRDGKIRESKYRESVTMCGKKIRIYVFLAHHFIPKTKEDVRLNRNCIDHITHNPIGMNINDVRNLRWCTHKENMGFPEARENNKKAHLGSKHEPRSEFGKKFFEHYGLHSKEDVSLYSKECRYYHYHKKCSWEE